MKYNNITGDSVRHEILVILIFYNFLSPALRNYESISIEIFFREHNLDNITDNVNRDKVSIWLWIKIQILTHLT